MGNAGSGYRELDETGRRVRQSSSSSGMTGGMTATAIIFGLVLAGILTTGILSTVFAKQAADNTAPNNARKIAFQTDFRDEVSALGICEMDFNDPLILGSSLSPAQAWQSFGPLHPLFCSQTSVLAGRFRVSNDDPSPPDPVNITGSNFWHTGPAIGARSDETMGFEAVASFDFNVNNTAALGAYTAGTLVGDNPRLDMRIVTPGMILVAVDTKSSGCVPTVDGAGCFMSICIFASQNAVWAIHDVLLGFGTTRQLARGTKIAEFPTTEVHTYRCELDRKNKQARYYIDGVLKLTLPIGGAPIAPITGTLWVDRGTVPVPVHDPDFGIAFVSTSLNFRTAGIWPSTKGLEPNVFFPPLTETFPTALDKPSVQLYSRQAGVSLQSMITYTQKSA